ncbi:hypothetical protein AhnVgp044 [Adoxophyes honmai nucleopolyhedrovirus]|uniref:Uncharacterized protein n=1 Tax=Adoxophyes honmai nucleopolyhedrovirus TaxID=224399 RepID=Q80LQ2_NPVAH|nr:hypothetical protein AhnVgp044 [Adoxophyes honmai nucleopolyhedrovirus]BAC67295.1 hypothetical protein [Adoxophyes honmai nucleopolyhedrovirus]
MSNTSTSDLSTDIFDKKKVKIFTNIKYNELKRYKFVNINDNGDFLYYDRLLEKNIVSPKKKKTIDDYNDYEILLTY